MPNLCHGRNGEDLILKVPSGTLVRDEESRELICDLKSHGDKLCIAKGGRG
jgi:GTP-binding protein